MTRMASSSDSILSGPRPRRARLLTLFPGRRVAERVRGSEEKPQVRRGGATGASAGANHTSARQSREERDEIPSAMLAAIGDLVHLLGLVSHSPPRPSSTSLPFLHPRWNLLMHIRVTSHLSPYNTAPPAGTGHR